MASPRCQRRNSHKLHALLGASSPRLKESRRTPTVIMMVGLQGSGKTTTTSKLAKYLSKNGRYPLVVSTDVARPAAREQLGILAGKIGVKFMQPPTDAPLEIVKKAISECRSMCPLQVHLKAATPGRTRRIQARFPSIATRLLPHPISRRIESSVSRPGRSSRRQSSLRSALRRSSTPCMGRPNFV